MAGAAEQIRVYLASHSTGVLATCHGHRPHAATIHFVARDYSLFFAAMDDTRKCQDMLLNPEVSLAIDNQSVHEFLQYDGYVTFLDEIENRTEAARVLDPIYPRARYWIRFPEVRFVRVDPTRIKIVKGPPRKRGEFGDCHTLTFGAKGGIIGEA